MVWYSQLFKNFEMEHVIITVLSSRKPLEIPFGPPSIDISMLFYLHTNFVFSSYT